MDTMVCGLVRCLSMPMHIVIHGAKRLGYGASASNRPPTFPGR